MSDRNIAELGWKMRKAQKRYFTSRERLDLEEARKLEAEFDRRCAEVLAGRKDDVPGRQRGLFDNNETGR